MPLQDSLNEILACGINKLGLDVGIISNVDSETYKVFACVNGTPDINAGDEFELSNTYCADVINENKTKYYADVAKITGMLKHPCYLYTQLRAYIGTPIIVHGKIWGTLNYSSLSPRESIYTNNEVDFLELQAKDVATLLEQQT
jgi:GAF domain-containing protein